MGEGLAWYSVDGWTLGIWSVTWGIHSFLFCKTLLKLWPTPLIHTLPFYLTTAYILAWNMQWSLLYGAGSHSMQWEHQTVTKGKQKTGSQGFRKRNGSRTPSGNPASISTRGMVAMSPKSGAWSQAMEGAQGTVTQ